MTHRQIRIGARAGGAVVAMLAAAGVLVPTSAHAAVTCEGLTVTRAGTAGNDIIQGTDGRDIINALGGNDTVNGLGGNDVICGGDGKKKMNGGGCKETPYRADSVGIARRLRLTAG